MAAICMDASVDLQGCAHRQRVGCGVPIKNGAPRAIFRSYQAVAPNLRALAAIKIMVLKLCRL